MATETLQRTAIPSGFLTSGNGIAWLVLDDSAKKVNTLSTRLFEWFEEQVSLVERERPAALVILSGKPDGFVAGADIEELKALAEPEDVLAMLRRGHELMNASPPCRSPRSPRSMAPASAAAWSSPWPAVTA